MKGQLFRDLVSDKDEPLSIFGTVNAYSSVLAKNNGVKSIYLSGSGVAASSFGLPDLGFTKLGDVIEDARRITSSCDLPLLVDIDTGFGSTKSIQNAIKSVEKENVAAIHIEDQVDLKRCGHRPNKKLVSIDKMKDIEIGADMIFPEAITSLGQYKKIADASSVPILANITEFGKTPLFSKMDLHKNGVSMILYPLSAFRAMSKAAEKIYKELLNAESQKNILNDMQTRDELYNHLSYYKYEKEMDNLLNNKNE